jgi:hypothetical protein
MRYQERIYIQNENRGVRNKDILNVNMSSDICIFSSPTFNVSGATKVQCGSIEFDAGDFNIDTTLIQVQEACGLSEICLSATTWVTKLYTDGELASEDEFFVTSIYTGTPTTIQLTNSIQNCLLEANYSYEKTDTIFKVYKPYGVKDIEIDVCISFYAQTACTANTCVNLCRNVFTGTFSNIDNTSNGVYVLNNTATTIPLFFDFTGNTSTFLETNANFKFEIYKFIESSRVFKLPAEYRSGLYEYFSFSGTNQLLVNIPLSGLNLDGEYIIKGYFESNLCTDFLRRLGRTLDTSVYKLSTEYGIYNPDTDFYFLAIREAERPVFDGSSSDEVINSPITLYQQVIYVDFTKEGNEPLDENDISESTLYERTGSTFVLSSEYIGDVVVTLNGLSLAKDLDYTLSGQVLTFIGPISNNDVITIVYTRTTTNTLISNTISVNTAIPSGQTNTQGTSKYFYNTTTGKYEVYTNNEPFNGTAIMVMLNGVTLLNNIDYYQSTTNPNRIILNGTLMVGDIVTIIYYPKAIVINGITQLNTFIGWAIDNPPIAENGVFSLEYSTTPSFTGYTVSDLVPYQVGVSSYSGLLTLTGSAGTNLYYRVRNTKNYESICGDLIESIAFSEVVPITIETNVINAY